MNDERVCLAVSKVNKNVGLTQRRGFKAINVNVDYRMHARVHLTKITKHFMALDECIQFIDLSCI